MTVSGLKGFEVRGDNIVILDASIGDVERVVHMKETNSDVSDLDEQGHSVGRWEDDVLVVETVFNADVVKSIVGVPLSPASRLVERFELTPDRSMLKYSFAVESPDYLVLPFTPRSDGWAWTFEPDLDVPRLACEGEVARRFEIAAQQDLIRSQRSLQFLLE
jgi:hypothetical protein